MGVELAILAALIKKLVDFLRSLRGKDTNAVVTQIVAWASGIVVVFLAAHVDFASAVQVANVSLDQMNIWTQTVLGVVLASVGSLFQDGLKAIDNTQSEAKPVLVPESTEVR